jgi:O-antigen/teichoic acid export membrane protein
MNVSLRDLARKIFDFGLGEALARLCSVTTLLLLAHKFGVVFVGIYALAQGMVQYSYPFIDFGLRHVGARLIAKYPQAGEEIALQVQRRRLRMAALLIPILMAYAASVKLPASGKLFVFSFAAVGSLYALSLDWAAWGKEHLRLASFGRASVPACVLLALLLGHNSENVLWWLVGGNVAGNLLQAAIFSAWWHRHQPAHQEQIPLEQIRDALAWRRTSVMGLAWFCNMAFASIDMLMLGVMSNPRQVGLYSAAYRILSQVLFTYYLMTSVLYPQLARQSREQRLSMLRSRILLTVGGLGFVIAGIVTLVRRPVIAILFGGDFQAATLLLMLLAWAIPLDFVTSYLTNAYIAWGMEKQILLCTFVAASSNVVLNLFAIPRYGATGTAVNTLISYVILLVSLALVGRSAKELTVEPVREPELIV